MGCYVQYFSYIFHGLLQKTVAEFQVSFHSQPFSPHLPLGTMMECGQEAFIIYFPKEESPETMFAKVLKSHVMPLGK